MTGTKPMPCVKIGGHNYYPDHIIWKNDFTIALDVKRYDGKSSALQQVIGQLVIYSQMQISQIVINGRSVFAYASA